MRPGEAAVARAAIVLLESLAAENDGLRGDVAEAERQYHELGKLSADQVLRDGADLAKIAFDAQRLTTQHAQDVASITALQKRIEADASLVTELRLELNRSGLAHGEEIVRVRAELSRVVGACEAVRRDLELVEAARERTAGDLDTARTEVTRLEGAVAVAIGERDLAHKETAQARLELKTLRNLNETQRVTIQTVRTANDQLKEKIARLEAQAQSARPIGHS